jgi:putative spermidine/putrescine transport system permease protein
VLQNFDWDLERAALSLGANRIKVWLKVTFPVILTGLISAALFAFLRSFDELLMALFISGIQAKTLPKRMWEGIREEINPTIAAVSTLLIGLYILVMLAREFLSKRRENPG